MAEAAEIETFNKFMVGVRVNDIVIIKPAQVLSKADALLLAAWLVALADDDDRFNSVLEAVQNT